MEGIAGEIVYRFGAVARDDNPVNWPDGFMWGTGVSSTQCEGAAPGSTWLAWEQAGKAPPSGDGNGFAKRYAEDFALYAAAGLRHHRLGIDWARIEPEEGTRDPKAVEHYRNVLHAARGAGIEVWVCLHHFTLPVWFAEQGGFGNTEARTQGWAKHVDFVAETYGDLVAGWKPINEGNIYAVAGWGGGGFPPGRRDTDELFAQTEGVHLAAFEAALRLRQTGAPTASIHALAPIVPLDPGADRVVKRREEVLWRPWLDATREGILRVPRREPIERPEFTEAFDLIGFSYYSAAGVTADGAWLPYPDDAPRSPLGYSIWADGLGLVLDRLHEELPGRPLLVSEYGIGTDDDAQRAKYIERGLEIVRDALGRGIDVRGFFHWTGVDNYEWLHGYDVKFGLWDRDRKPRGSLEVLSREALR
jgi:beta-glucosidase